MSDEPADRVRTLLLRADNVLKSGDASRYGRVRATLEEAREIARDPRVDPPVAQLIERRLEALAALETGGAPG